MKQSGDNFKAGEDHYTKMRTDWRSQVENHPQLGGERLQETLGVINKAISTLPPKLQTDFKAALDYTGAGDNPAVVEVFYNLAKSVTEGQHVSGSGPSTEGQNASGKSIRPTAATAMFPNLPSASTQH